MKWTYIFLLLVAMILLYFSPQFFGSSGLNLSAEEHIENGKQFRNEDNLWKAREAFRLAIKKDPDNAEAYFLKGSVQMELNYFEDAVTDFSQALQLKPSNGNAYYNRGLALAQLKNYSGAIEDFNKALELNPGDVAAYRDRGVAKQFTNDRLGALEDFRTAVELNPNYAAAQVSFGSLLAELGRVDEGIDHLNKALALDPTLKKHFIEQKGCGPTWDPAANSVAYVDCG